MANGIINKLICGDNLEVLATIPKESVDLIYIDPPFFSNKQYEVVWGDEAEVRSFKDRWEGGIEHFVGWLTPRVQAMYDVLNPTGSLYLHCDWRANAHIRIMLDNIFGTKCFRNEIIWHFGIGGKSEKQWARKHNTIFYYTKSKKWIFESDSIRLPFTPHKRSKTGSYGGRMGVDADGRQFVEKWGTGKKKLYRYYIDEGKIPEDVWSDVQTIQPGAKERMGYPTQKPEALLERIIQASSKKESLVLDAFCGCGTAMIVSQKLGRKWIGIDISPTAIKLIQKRFKNIGALKDREYIVVGEPKTIQALKKLEPFEFQNWVINEMQASHSRKKVGDMGLDGYVVKNLFREGAGIQVKQSEDVGRNVVDNFKSALDRAKHKKGYIVAFSFGKGAVEEVDRLRNSKDVDIQLVMVEDLLSKKTLK